MQKKWFLVSLSVLFVTITCLFSISAVINNSNNSVLNNQHTGNVIDREKRLIYSPDSSINNLEKINGYIVQFKEEPVVLVDARAKEKIKQLKESGINQEAALVEKDLPNKVKAQKIKIYNEHKNALEDIKVKLGKTKIKELNDKNNLFGNIKSAFTGFVVKITGKAVDSKNESELQILNEFEGVFNGVALNITIEEAEKVKQSDYVKAVYPNLEVKAELMDSVPLIGADQVWRMKDSQNNNLTGKGVTIAIIDTGVDYTHSDLGGCLGVNCKVIGGYDFVNNDANPMDDHGHGTHVAATAAGKGVLNGVAPDAKIFAYKVLNSYGSGSFDNIIAAIERAVQDNVSVISMSLGANCGVYSINCGPDDVMSQVVDNAVSVGVVAVIAAGNSGPNQGTIITPGTSRKAITVGAVYKKDYSSTYFGDQNPKRDQITSFSSRGPVIKDLIFGYNLGLIKPDILAPGALICAARWDSVSFSNPIYSICVDDRHIQLAGTSMATPHITGVVALIKQAHPSWSPDDIKGALKDGATDLGYDINTQGSGVVNSTKSLSLARPPVAEISSIVLSNNGNVSIIGSATSDNFASYEVYYMPYQSTTDIFSLLCQSKNQVYNNALCVAQLYDGQYKLKLITNGNNLKTEDTKILTLKASEIIFPLDFRSRIAQIDDNGARVLSSNYIINISGYAGGPGFKYYNITWCFSDQKGNIAGGCSNSGISLINNGAPRVMNSTLGFFDLSILNSSGFYLINLNSYNGSNSKISYNSVLIYVMTSIRKGWPVHVDLNLAGYYRSDGQPIIADLNKDGRKEIIISSRNNLLMYDPNGSLIKKFDLPNYYNGYIAEPAIGDLYNDGSDEMVIPSEGRVMVIFYNGTMKEIHLDSQASYSMATLADLNNDAKLDIILGNNLNRLSVIDGNGNYLKGWENIILSSPDGGSGPKLIPTISVGDLDKDGRKEVIAYIQQEISPSFKIYAFYANGTILNGFPKNFSGQNIKSSPILADLNKDGQRELFFATDNGMLYAFYANGSALNGWPINASGFVNYIYSAQLGSLDKNEVWNLGILGSRQTDVWINGIRKSEDCALMFNITGSSLVSKNGGWPICKSYSGTSFGTTQYLDYLYLGYNSKFIFGNIDQGKSDDIIITTSYLLCGSYYGCYPASLNAFDTNGTILNGFPKNLSLPMFDTAQIKDLDSDGKNELVVMDRSGNIYIWNTNGTSENDAWPQFQHDAQHTGCYDCDKKFTFYNLTINKFGGGLGIINSSEGKINCGTNCSTTYLNGTSTILTATPVVGSLFTGWSGCNSINGNSCLVNITQNKSIGATFISCINQTLAYYPFNNYTLSGKYYSNLSDISGNKYNGRSVALQLSAAGLVGNSLNLFGNTQSHSILPNNVLDNRSRFSVALWIKSNGTGDGIFSVANSQRNGELLIQNQQNLVVNYKGNSYSINRVLNNNQWHFIAVNVDSITRIMNVYVDGVLVKSVSITNIPIFAQGIVVGQRQTNVLGGYNSGDSYLGQIDELAIFNRTLTANEIVTLYNSGLGKAVCS